MEYTTIGAINKYRSESINPALYPDRVFEVYSVPIFETGHPEFLRGDEIGSTKQVVQKDDVLICKINPRINRVWTVANESDKQNIASSEWIVVRNQEYNPEFLAWYFRSSKFKALMVSEVAGIGGSLTRAQPKRVAGYPVPLLQRSQQDAIVQRLNSVTRIIEARQRQLHAFDTLIKARFVELFGDPVANTKGWKTVFLYEVTSKIGSGATPRGGKESYQHEGISLIRSMNVHDGRFEYKDLAHISDEQAAQLDNVTVEPYDVFINITGASVARSCVVPIEVLPARVNQHVAIIRCIQDKILPLFANNMFLNDRFKGQLLDIGELGGATRQAITKQQLEALTIIMPPLQLQEDFASFVSQVDKSKTVVQVALDKAQLLFDSLMQQYFG